MGLFAERAGPRGVLRAHFEDARQAQPCRGAKLSARAALALDVQAMEAFLPDQPEEIPMPDIVIPLHRNLGAALGVAPDMNGPREIVEPRIYVAGKAPCSRR